jgi:hypothetical protein
VADDPRNYLNRPLAEGVRRVGFRKWYERELLSSHAHLVLTLLATVAMMGAAEAFGKADLQGKLMDVALFLISAGIGLWALRRYLYLLMHAESVANQANCPDCKTYGRFTVEQDNPQGRWVRVCCRKCGHRWPIEY